jgi:putative membrane protein
VAGAQLLPGVAFRDTTSLVLAALLLGIVNAVVKPVMTLLTLPLTFITLGLFLLVINAAMIGLTAMFLPGFEVDGFIPALLTWAVVAATSWAASAFTRDR